MSRTIAFFIFEGFQLLDAAGPIAAFEMAARSADPAPYRLKFLAREGGPIRSSSGAPLLAETADAADSIDTLIIVGGQGVRQARHCAKTLEFIREQAQKARRVCSVCTGTYVLASAGLLERRRATTHWRQSAHFAQTFRNVRLEPDNIYIRDGNVWTSAGVTAGIDLSLALIAADLGDAAARHVAREMVVFYRRPGGQSQFSALLEIDPPDSRFKSLLGWIRENLAEDLSVERLAEKMNMSPRNFARAFVQATSITPAKAVERIRVEAARAHIENSTDPIEIVARANGFTDAERMRRAFIRTFGHPPQSLRRASRSEYQGHFDGQSALAVCDNGVDPFTGVAHDQSTGSLEGRA